MTQIIPERFDSSPQLSSLVIEPTPDPKRVDSPQSSAAQLRLDRALSPGLYPQFILFGDSIIEQGTRTLQAALQQLYVRRLDVLNRGFSGYTSPMGFDTIPHFLPLSTPAPRDGSELLPPVAPIKLFILFFGANDACVPGQPQHVDLPVYIRSLSQIINYPVLKRHQTKVILVTPPPINEHQFPPPLTRTARNAARYAAACRQLAVDLNIPCVDIWTAFLKLAGYDPSSSFSSSSSSLQSSSLTSIDKSPSSSNPDQNLNNPDSNFSDPYESLPGSSQVPPNPILPTLLLDGLHLTPKGYEIFLHELMTVIKNQVTDCLPENLPIVFPQWRKVLGVPPAN